ncbi:MAG TPA: hypothetical protein DCO69_04850 [Clostridiales bacterium]|nr:hypothetical protein [Clostridiales bacterium]
MARKVLIINGHDYSGFVAEDGYQWEDNDIDGDGAGRAMDTMMDRDLLADKTKLQISCRDLLQSESSAILTDIKQEFYEATVLDACKGEITCQMYTSSRKAAIAVVRDDGEVVWSGLSFSMIER